ncbi:MAG: sigma 54-interacting transcriptional regulator [Pseudomonadota bacterium]
MTKTNKLPIASTIDVYLTIVQGVVSELSPRNGLHVALENIVNLLAQSPYFVRPHLVVHDAENGLLRLATTHQAAKEPDTAYTPGAGVTGQVFSTAKPMIVPCMREHANFGNHIFARNDDDLNMAFICVPVCVDHDDGYKVVGTLSVDTPSVPDGQDSQILMQHCLFLESVASMIGRKVSWLQDEMLAQHFIQTAQVQDAELSNKSPIIATSKAMQQVLRQIAQAAPSRATVLLRGESGVGKELLAEAIHNASSRRDKPYVKLNCAAIPSELVEGELFGWKKGAFTGASHNRKGVFEQAHGGTLFLDEIGDLSLSAQAKVLRALQDRDIQILGSEQTISVDVRLVCATNRPLEQMVEERLFREDLYYRINVFPIYIPALRERRDDIVPLVDNYIAKMGQEYKNAQYRISTPALDMLLLYHWPGNIRELKNCIERAVLVCDDGVIRTHHFPPSLQLPTSRTISQKNESKNPQNKKATFTEHIERVEKELLVDALKESRGNIHQAARNIDLTYRIFQYKLNKYGVDYKRFLVMNTTASE